MGKLSFPGIGIGEFDINSVIFSLFDGKLVINWYAVIITTGIVLAAVYVLMRFKENGLKTDDFLDLALWVVVCGILGARLYFILFKLDDYIITSHDNFFKNLGASLYEMIAVWKGGLAIYGGVIAGGLAAFFVARKKKLNILQILDFLAPAVMMAQSLGRWGNFFNIEAFGSITDSPLRMCSPTAINYLIRTEQLESGSEIHQQMLAGTLGVHPTFFYESMWNLVGFLVLWLVFVQISKTKFLHKFHGQLFYSYLIWYGLGRLWIEGLRTDSLYLIPNVIRVSQLVALLSLLAGVALMVTSFVLLKKGKGGKFVELVDHSVVDKFRAEAKQKNEENKKNKENKKKEGTKNGKNNKRQASFTKRQRGTKG